MKVAVSFLKSNYDKQTTIKKIEATDCDYIHVDVMDGEFVKEKTEDLVQYLQNTSKKLDVHLMVENPINYINIYKKLNTEYITIHAEISENVESLLNLIKSYNIKCGIAINPDTTIDSIKKYLPLVDQILIMSVYPGKGGQPFIPSTIAKVQELAKIKNDFIINIDGGINNTTINDLRNIGLDMVVSGSYVCQSDDFQTQIDSLR